jgi:para-aminobenzoate synthetase component 1
MATQEIELPVAPSDLVTRCAGEPFVCALDGGDVGSWGTGRALLAFRPRAILWVNAHGEARMRERHEHHWHGHPFDLLDRFCAAMAPATAEPFGGGVVAALSYDLRHWVERLPARARDDLGLPVLYAAAYDWLLSYSYADRRYRLASAHCSGAELRTLGARLAALAARPAANVRGQPQRFSVTNAPAPTALFAALQRQHRMPFAAYVDGGDFALVSNSPECFLTVDEATVATFPIKGTRPRHADASADRALAAQLRADSKERAEHVMIVDLERNDLGRVCRTGTVRVD